MHLYNLAGVGAVPPTYTTNQLFEAHEWLPDLAAGVGYTFRNGAGAPNIVNSPNPVLSVSGSGLFAVEHADLSRRQPKHFFADPVALDGWNKTLARQGSLFQFFLDPPGTVTFTLPGAGAPTTLSRVRPANLRDHCAGNDMTTTESCDVAVQEVIGSVRMPLPVLGRKVHIGSDNTQKSFFEYHVANHFVQGLPLGDLPIAPVLAHTTAQDVIAQRFGEATRAAALGVPIPHNPHIVADMQAVGVNEFARPTKVGQGLYSASLGPSHPHAPVGFEVQDYRNNVLISDAVSLNRVLWGFHWGGVIAMDGTDYLTLENYARNGENSFGHGGGLFYFHMYGAGPGESWHEQWTPPPVHGKSFANPITVTVAPDGLTGLRYFTPGSKTTHAAVGAALNDANLRTALLDGLNYANVHRYATSLAEEYADRVRLAAWTNEVTNRLAPPLPAWISPVTRSLAQHVGTALAAVKRPPV